MSVLYSDYLGTKILIEGLFACGYRGRDDGEMISEVS